MYYYTRKSQFRKFADELTASQQRDLRKNAASRSANGTTFLSHSSKDNELLIGAVRVLEGHGATVYIDEKDPAMPPYTSEETAAIIKDRIRQTKRFVLLASDQSKDSRWVPWELGVADGVKGMGNIALFPAIDDDADDRWTSWEYLGLYRRIVWGDLDGEPERVWMVLNEEENTATELSKWLRGR